MSDHRNLLIRRHHLDGWTLIIGHKNTIPSKDTWNWARDQVYQYSKGPNCCQTFLCQTLGDILKYELVNYFDSYFDY